MDAKMKEINDLRKELRDADEKIDNLQQKINIKRKLSELY
jgi:predicted RNase H-like nuclease (RuvC/YqgF family)